MDMTSCTFGTCQVTIGWMLEELNLGRCIVASQFFVFNVVDLKTCLAGRFDQTYPGTTAVGISSPILKWTFNQENVDQEGFVLQKYL